MFNFTNVSIGLAINNSGSFYFISNTVPVIKLTTIIQADIGICFDLSRSIDLHCISTAGTDEKAVAGITSGLIGINETVTWQATHFCIKQRLTSKITTYESPFHFRDEQLQGAFSYIKHDHFFKRADDTTVMRDHFDYGIPYGVIGLAFDQLVLNNYLRRFLIKRNNIIKNYAENGSFRNLPGFNA